MAEEKKVTPTGPQLQQLAIQEERKLSDANSRIATLSRFRTELYSAKEALEEISKSEKGEKILVNLGAGVFVEASVENSKKAISSIAGDIFNEKENPEIIKGIDRKLEGINKQLEKEIVEQEKIVLRLNQLGEVLEAGRRAIVQRQRGK